MRQQINSIQLENCCLKKAPCPQLPTTPLNLTAIFDRMGDEEKKDAGEKADHHRLHSFPLIRVRIFWVLDFYFSHKRLKSESFTNIILHEPEPGLLNMHNNY